MHQRSGPDPACAEGSPDDLYRITKLDSQLSFDDNKAIPLGFSGSSDGQEFACDVGDPGSIPGLGRSSGEGNGNTSQYSCLENPMDRGDWRVIVHGVRVRHD